MSCVLTIISMSCTKGKANKKQKNLLQSFQKKLLPVFKKSKFSSLNVEQSRSNP